MSDKDRIDREVYCVFLSKRLSTMVEEETTPEIMRDREFWIPLIPIDRAAIAAMEKYERGEISKEELDQATIDYLHALRAAVRDYKARKAG